jgi:hypothetical protein
VIELFKNHYAIGLIAGLLAPLWLSAASMGFSFASLRDAIIWTGVLLGCWLLITKHPGFRVRGVWRLPTSEEVKFYTRSLLGVLLLDFGSKALFFRWDRPHQVELVKNFGLHSVFHETAFEPFHLILLIYFFYLFFLGGMFFRYANPTLDRIWMICCTFALGGGIALFGERALFGGVHNSFYFSGPLMWICPPCASPIFSSYAWTPADLFVHAAFMPPFILLTSYFVRAQKVSEAGD